MISYISVSPKAHALQDEVVESGLLIRLQCNSVFGVVMEEGRSEEGFYRCPFCPCVFCSRIDLERHLSAFGNIKEQHSEEYKRCHSRIEYSPTE
jgi:uncharacterized C2H2 Zn-finger protein